jgi:hypothetical protein
MSRPGGAAGRAMNPIPAILTGQVIFHCSVCFGNQYTAFGALTEQNEALTVLPSTTSTTAAAK